MKLVDIDTKITALLWDDEHEEYTEQEKQTMMKKFMKSMSGKTRWR